MLSRYQEKRLKTCIDYYYPCNLKSKIEEFKGNKIMHISITNVIDIETIQHLNDMIGKVLSNKFLIIYYNHLTGKNEFSKDISERIQYMVYQIFKSDGMKGVDKILKDMIDFYYTIDFAKEIANIDNLRFQQNPKGFQNNTENIIRYNY